MGTYTEPMEPKARKTIPSLWNELREYATIGPNNREVNMDIHPLRLVYFSPTGTTRKVAQAIAQGLGKNTTEDLDLTLPQTGLGSVSSIQGGLTIIGTPVYTGRVAFEAVLRLRQFRRAMHWQLSLLCMETGSTRMPFLN